MNACVVNIFSTFFKQLASCIGKKNNYHFTSHNDQNEFKHDKKLEATSAWHVLSITMCAIVLILKRYGNTLSEF